MSVAQKIRAAYYAELIAFCNEVEARHNVPIPTPVAGMECTDQVPFEGHSVSWYFGQRNAMLDVSDEFKPLDFPIDDHLPMHFVQFMHRNIEGLYCFSEITHDGYVWSGEHEEIKHDDYMLWIIAGFVLNALLFDLAVAGACVVVFLIANSLGKTYGKNNMPGHARAALVVQCIANVFTLRYIGDFNRAYGQDNLKRTLWGAARSDADFLSMSEHDRTDKGLRLTKVTLPIPAPESLLNRRLVYYKKIGRSIGHLLGESGFAVGSVRPDWLDVKQCVPYVTAKKTGQPFAAFLGPLPDSLLEPGLACVREYFKQLRMRYVSDTASSWAKKTVAS